MGNKSIRTISYIALYVALYVVFKYVGNMIPFLAMPNGGSIELELIPVFIASYHLGWKYGAVTALLSWLITIVLGVQMWFVHPVQIALDYALPLIVCGMASLLWPFRDLKGAGSAVMAVILAAAAFFGITNSFLSEGNAVPVYICSALAAAGIFAFSYWYLRNKKKFGIVLSMLLKYLFTVLSGAYYWAGDAGAGSAAAWTFSLGYNLWYNLVTMIVCILIVPVLIEQLKKAGVKFIAE